MNLTHLKEADSDPRAMLGLGISPGHEAECSSSDRAIRHDRNTDAEPVHPSPLSRLARKPGFVALAVIALSISYYAIHLALRVVANYRTTTT